MGKISTVLALLMLFGGSAFSQSPEPSSRSPVVKSEQQTDGALKARTHPDNQTTSATNSAASEKESASAGEPKSQEKPKEEANEASEFWTIGRRTFKITDSLLVGFTFLLFLATVALFFATRDLVKGADKNAEKQLRAYVFVRDGGVIITPDGGGFTVNIALKNFGQTPASEFSTWLGGDVFDADAIPFPKERKPLSERVNRSIVGPTAEVNINSDSAYLDDLSAIRNGTKAIFVWGGVDYVDAFGEPRHLIIRAKMTGPERDLGNGNRGWALKPHALGYEAN